MLRAVFNIKHYLYLYLCPRNLCTTLCGGEKGTHNNKWLNFFPTRQDGVSEVELCSDTEAISVPKVSIFFFYNNRIPDFFTWLL